MAKSKKTADIAITLMVEDQPILHSVTVGLDDLPSFVIRTGETPSGVDIQVSTGHPFEKDAESIEKIASFFDLLVHAFRDEKFVSMWVGAHTVSETE